MTQYSLGLNGEEWTDNEKLVDWECGKCRARFATRDAAVAHVRLEHGSGTVSPRLNAIGAQMVVMSLRLNTGQDTFGMAFDRRSGVLGPESFSGSMSQQQALNIIKKEEPKILSMMALKSEVVKATSLAQDLTPAAAFQESAGMMDEKKPFGAWLYVAAQAVLQPDLSNDLAVFIMANVFRVEAPEEQRVSIDEELSRCSSAEERHKILLRMATIGAADFLEAFPTLAEAQSHLSRLVSLRALAGGAPARLLVHDLQDKMAMQQLSDSTLPPAPPVDTAALRQRLQRLDSVGIESLCLDHFPVVYDKFARGLQRGEMINLLLDYCRRNPEDAARLADVVL